MISNKELNERESMLFFCPYCLKNIPLITVNTTSTDNMSLKINCTCLKEPINTSLTNFLFNLNNIPKSSNNQLQYKYCSNCSLWLSQEQSATHNDYLSNPHCLLDYEITVLCLQHSKPFISYCSQCSQNMCIDCISSHHQTHAQIRLYIHNQLNYDLANQLLQDNESKITKLMQKLDTLSLLASPEIKGQYFQMKEELTQLLYYNNTTNKELCQFFTIVFETALYLGKYLCYQLFQLYESMKICQYFERETTAEEEKTKKEHNDISLQVIKLRNQIPNTFVIKEKYKSQTLIPKRQANGLYCKKISNNLILYRSNNYSDYITKLICISTIQWEKDISLADKNITVNIGKEHFHIGNKALFIIEHINKRNRQQGNLKRNRQFLEFKTGQFAFLKYAIIKIWDLNNISAPAKLLNKHTDFIMHIIQLSNGCLASSSTDMTIKIWNMTTYQLVSDFISKTGSGYCYNFMLELNNNRLLCRAINFKLIQIFDLKTYRLIGQLTGHCDDVMAIIKLQDTRLVTCSLDKTIKIWETQSYSCIKTLTGHTDHVRLIKELYDNRLASSSRDRTIIIWNLLTYESIISIKVDGIIRYMKVMNKNELITVCLDGSLMLTTI